MLPQSDSQLITELSYFTSYFQMFAALNLLYAGSKKYRHIIDNSLLQIRKIDANTEFKFDLLEAKMIFFSRPIEANQIIESGQEEMSYRRGFQIYSNGITTEIEKIETARIESEKYIDSFDAMFFNSALYCMAIVAISGFEQYYKSGYSIFSIVVFLQLSLLFNLVIFVKSFTKYKAATINPIIIFIFFLAFFITGILFSKCEYAPLILKITNEKGVYLVGTLIALSPYILHFLRAILHRAYYTGKSRLFLKNKLHEVSILNKFFGLNNNLDIRSTK